MPEDKHSFTRTEVMAGLMVLASAAVLALFIAAVSGLRPPHPTKIFYTDFVNIKGLHAGAEVMFGGVSVGRVRKVAFGSGRNSKIRVEFDVLNGVPVNAQSKVKIDQTTLTSENHLEVTTGQDDAPLLAGGATLESQEGGIFDMAEQVGDGVNELLGDVRDMLGAKDTPKKDMVTIADLTKALQGALDESTQAVRDVRKIVADNRGDAEQIIKKAADLEQMANGLVGDLRGVVAENREGLNKTVDSVQQAVERVSKATERLTGMADSLDQALAKLNGFSGDASGFVEKARPVLEQIILDVRETIWHLKEFSRKIEEQPEAVLRGATPQGRKR